MGFMWCLGHVLASRTGVHVTLPADIINTVVTYHITESDCLISKDVNETFVTHPQSLILIPI